MMLAAVLSKLPRDYWHNEACEATANEAAAETTLKGGSEAAGLRGGRGGSGNEDKM